MKRNPIHLKTPTPSGFTLIELLVVIGIMIVLTAMTLSMINVTQDEDRVRSGAAQVQSFLEGARDRAIHAGEPRGVRFIPDTQDPSLVTSLLYIGAPSVYGDPETDVERVLNILPPESDPITGEPRYYVDLLPNEKEAWDNFFRRRLIEPGKTILKIGKKPYTFERVVVAGDSRYFLTTQNVSPGGPFEYLLHLNPVVLPNQEPRLLPRAVVIDLDHSARPDSWGGPTTTNPSAPYGTLDILFSPDGTVTGVEASAGVVHLVVADQEDVDLGFAPGQQSVTASGETIERAGNERIVSLRTQTGGIGVHNVDPTDGADADTLPDDPFRYAALGETAK